MTNTDAIGERLIPSADASDRRPRDSNAAADGIAADSRDKTGFPELISRLAAMDEDLAGTRPSTRHPGGARTCYPPATNWQQSGEADSGMPAGDETEVAAPERVRIVDCACGSEMTADLSPGLPNSSVPSGPFAQAGIEAVAEARSGVPATDQIEGDARSTDPSAQAARSLEMRAPATLVTEVEAVVSVLRRETHLAPMAPARLWQTTDRPAGADRTAQQASTNIEPGPAPVAIDAAKHMQSVAGGARAGQIILDGPEEPGREAGRSSSPSGLTDRARLLEPRAVGPGDGAQALVRPRAVSTFDAEARFLGPGDHVRLLERESAAAGERERGRSHAAPTPGASADGTPRADRPSSEPVADDFDAGLDPRASSVRQSQPASLPQSSPVQQIVDRIAAQLVDAQRSEAQSAQSVRSASLSSGAPLRVLSIQLQPADLGTVTVRMSLKEDTLELQLEAANPETARLISRDREALSGLLRSAGYLIDGLSVQVTEPDRTTASAGQQGLQGTQTLLQSSTQSQSGSSQPDARSSNPHQQAAQHNSNHPASGDDDGSDQHAARPVDGALYV